MVPLIRSRSQPPANGFSLPELMIIVVTVLVLAGVVGPTFSNLLRQQRLRSSGWALAASINAAPQPASTSSKVQGSRPGLSRLYIKNAAKGERNSRASIR